MRHCIICKKKLNPAITTKDGELSKPPNGGVNFISKGGNYGSAVIDDVGGNSLYEICLCDKCLEAESKYVRVYYQFFKQEVVDKKNLKVQLANEKKAAREWATSFDRITKIQKKRRDKKAAPLT